MPELTMGPEYFSSAPPPDADARVRQLYAYWRRIHAADGGLPGRQRLDPIAIPLLLPFVWLADVQRVPLRFRYRLFGTEHVRVLGRDFTGCWIDEAHPNFLAATAYAQFVAAAEQGTPGYRRGHTLIIL